MRKKHNTFVHIYDKKTFARKHQGYTVLTSRIQKETKVNSDSRNLDVF